MNKEENNIVENTTIDKNIGIKEKIKESIKDIRVQSKIAISVFLVTIGFLLIILGILFLPPYNNDPVYGWAFILAVFISIGPLIGSLCLAVNATANHFNKNNNLKLSKTLIICNFIIIAVIGIPLLLYFINITLNNFRIR